jgi:hypothetical protein
MISPEIHQQIVSLINDTLNKFQQDTNSVVKYNNSLEAREQFIKKKGDIFLFKCVYSSDNEDILYSSADFIFALQHSHINPINVSIIVKRGNNEPSVLHQFIAYPNKSQWLLNGTQLPSIKCCWNKPFLKCVDIVTNEEVIIQIELYGGHLNKDHQRNFIMETQICCLDNNNTNVEKYIIFDRGCIEINSFAFLNHKNHFMYKDPL